MEKRLFRSRTDRVVFGVCGGLARYFNVDPVLVRVISVLGILFTLPLGILAYLVLGIIIPLEGSSADTPKDTVKENVEEMKKTAGGLGRDLQSTLSGEREAERSSRFGLIVLGIGLIILGILFLLGSLSLFWWLGWAYIWPLILIAIGVLIIFTTRRR